MPNDTNTATAPVDFSAGLVPKAPAPTASGQIDFSAGLVPKDQALQSQPMVTNSVGETMPADVAARHALTREGKNFNAPDRNATGTAWEGTAKLGNFVEDVVTGLGKQGLQTIQGGVALANKGAKKLDPFDSPAHPTPQIPMPAAAADTETHGFGEGVGGFGENVLEFMSGEELLSGFSKVAQLEKLAQSSPAISNLVSKSPAIIKKIFGSAAKGAIVGGAQGAVKGAAEGKALEGAEGGAAGGAMGGVIGETASAGIGVLSDIFSDSTKWMMRAGRPGVQEEGFKRALETAKPVLLDATKDAKIKSVGDFEDILHNTAQDIRQNVFQPMIDRNAKQMVSAQPVAQNIRAAVTDQMREYAPEQAKEIEDFAAKFAKDMPLAKAEQDLQYFNAELKKFYKANAIDQSAALKTNGTVAKYEAAADGLRDLIYNKLTALGEKAPRQVQQQYGALKTLERVFGKRATVADRQATLNLPQALSWIGGAGELGALAFHSPETAAVAALPIIAAQATKHVNSPEFAIRQGLRAMAKESAPQTGPSAAGQAAKTAVSSTGAQIGRMITIRDSQGGIHTLPEDRLDEAKERDPDLKVIK